MQPKAIRQYAMARDAGGLLRVEEAGHECVLDPFAELIWELCDGLRTVEAPSQCVSGNRDSPSTARTRAAAAVYAGAHTRREAAAGSQRSDCGHYQ